MAELIPFAFDEHLVRAVWRGADPWFVGKDVCQVLGISKHHQALDALDPDERGTCSVGTPGGDQVVIVISEPGVYRLVFHSRKPEAERFKRWLAHDVLPQLRRTGRYELDGAGRAAEGAPEPSTSESLLHRLHLVREARCLFGRARAAKLWRQLGLPDVPPPPPTAIDEARIALRHLLDQPAHEGGPAIRALIGLALDDDEEARALLIGRGIRVLPERDAVLIANRHPGLEALLAGTEWAAPLAFMRLVRRLPGVTAAGPQRYGEWHRRGSLVAACAIDDCG